MQVRTGGAACLPYCAQRLPGLHHLSRADIEVLQVCVAGLAAIRVQNAQMVAVAWAVCRRSHYPALHRPHCRARCAGKVKPLMERRLAGKGVCPRAVGVRDSPRRGIQRKAILFRIPRGLHRQSRQQAEYQPCQHKCHDAPSPSAQLCCLSAPFCPHTPPPYPEKCMHKRQAGEHK